MASIGGNTSSAEEDQTTPIPPSAGTVSSNVDLLTSILLRLPAKPLIRFKSVAKHWLSLISVPNFSLLHTLQNPNPKPSGIFFPKQNLIEFEFISLSSNPSLPGAPPFRALDFVADPSGIQILQSCNGLLLCSNVLTWDRIMETQNYYVYNPTTKRFLVLAPPGGGGGIFLSILSRMSLAFDPSKSPHYKVVLVRGSNQYFRIQVYSSETRCWKHCGNDFEWPSFPMFCQGVFWNGAIHWASKKEGSMCFDVDLECHRPMPALPVFRDWDEASIRYFGESGGHLYLIDIQSSRIMEIDVFELERDYSQWSPKYRVDLNQFVAAYPNMVSQLHDELNFYNFSIISLARAEDEEESSLVLHVPGKVISYNFNDRSINHLRDPLPGEVDKSPIYRLRCFDGFQFIETLACV